MAAAVSAMFVVPTVAGARLPDNRAYELVSGPESGEPYIPPTPISVGPTANEARGHLVFRSAAGGGAIAYDAEPAGTGGTGEIGPGQGNQWVATRTAGGWVGEDVTPSVNFDSQYQTFLSSETSDGFSAAVFEGGSEASLAPTVESGCAVLYTRPGGGGPFAPLFTAGLTPETCGHPLFAGSSADLGHVIVQSEAALAPGSEEATEVPPGHEGAHSGPEMVGQPCIFGCNLYDLAAGSLHPVNVLAGKPVPNATFGGYAGERQFTNLRNAISADGSRIFWTDTEPGPNLEHVYVFEDGVENVPVSAGAAEYWAASRDGRYAYYTEAGGLWRFDTRTNTRLQVAEDSAEVQGVIGANETGESGAYLYFVANGVLTSTPNARGEHAVPGSCPSNEEASLCNLYLEHEGSIVFIASLSALDNRFESFSEGISGFSGDWTANLGERLAEPTPDGRHLVFQSVRPLTGYHYSVGVEEPMPSVFEYSADANSLACASCDPAGAPPTFNEFHGVGRGGHSKLPLSATAVTYMPRFVSENGNRVFFDSEQPLVPQDTNGVQDVYEWEREGEGSCAPLSPARSSGGCISVLSGGFSKNASFLVDADASGSNVFFEHVGALGRIEAPADHIELYDARVDGGFPSVSSTCSAASCEPGAAPPPSFSTPGSQTFEGDGNFAPKPPPPPPLTRAEKLTKALKACKAKQKKRKRVTCETQARKKYGSKKKRSKKHVSQRSGK